MSQLWTRTCHSVWTKYISFQIVCLGTVCEETRKLVNNRLSLVSLQKKKKFGLSLWYLVAKKCILIKKVGRNV